MTLQRFLLGCMILMGCLTSSAFCAETTLKGEIVDLQCYMANPKTGKGKRHAPCATQCINRGLPAGFLSEGKLYLLLGKGRMSVKLLVAKHAGKQVYLTGTSMNHSGMDAIQVVEVSTEPKTVKEEE